MGNILFQYVHVALIAIKVYSIVYYLNDYQTFVLISNDVMNLGKTTT